jgi:hypothetical protein
MQTKIDPEIWLTWEPYPVGTRMAMFWMLTNRDLTTAGSCLATKRQFECDTLLDWIHFERACEAFGDELFIFPDRPKASSPIDDASRMHPGSIPDASRIDPGSIPDASRIDPGSENHLESKPAPMISRRYWLKSFIRKQYATDGPSLCKNKVSWAIVRTVTAAHSAAFTAAVLAEYPSLRPLFSSSSEEKTTPSGSGMHPGSIPDASRRRGEERSGEEWNGKERSGKEGSPRENQPQPHEPSSPENKNPGGPEDIVHATELIERLGALLGRKKNQRALYDEEFHAANAHATAADLQMVEAWFRCNQDQPDFHPPQSLLGFLRNFQGQVDRARKYFANNRDALPSESSEKKFERAEEPANWRAALLEKYPDAVPDRWRSWWDVDKSLRMEFPQFPLNQIVVKKNNAAAPTYQGAPTPASA